MNSREFFDKVSVMRRLQREYSYSKNRTVQKRCADFERMIDAEIERVNALLGIRERTVTQRDLLAGEEYKQNG